MNAPHPIHIFRPGTHTDVRGRTLAFSESDLAASAAAYDPALHEAPLVVGHPAVDAPAYGWVRRLTAAPEGLVAEPAQVDPAFAELVRAGRYKKISASFYLPDAPTNPAPGVYYLRHVGFLGAAAPAVKGLKPVAFAAAEEGVVEFAEAADAAPGPGDPWARFRAWLGAMFGPAAAGVPPEAVPPAFAESGGAKQHVDFATPKEVPVDDKQNKEALEAERKRLADMRAALDKEKAEFAETRKKAEAAEAERRGAENAAFAEGLVKEGRLLPANKAAVAAVLDALSSAGGSVEFAEADGAKKTVAAAEALKNVLKSQPAVVDYAERAVGDIPGTQSADFAAPDGYAVDPERLALHNKALAYQTEHQSVTYAAAVAAVGGK